MKKHFLILLTGLLFLACKPVIDRDYEDPESTWGELFTLIQEENLFENEKEFWDATPNSNAEQLMSLFKKKKKKEDFDVKLFVEENFTIPDYSVPHLKSDLPFEEYLRQTFNALLTQPKNDGGSLIGTRMYYTSGGGMYNEYDYFTSYFALKGFQALGEDSLAHKMGTNAFQFIQDYNYIPYGNRTYYLGFSGLPMISLLAESIAEIKADMLPWFANLMGRLYQNDMGYGREDKKDLAHAIESGEKAFKSVVFLENDLLLNRYYNTSKGNKFINRAKATQWEHTSRFISGNQQQPDQFIPVDLNALMFHFERILARSYESKNMEEYAQSYINLSETRKKLVNEYLYNEEKGFYYDYNFETGQQSNAETLAAVFPLLTGMADEQQAKAVIDKIHKDFITPYGVLDDLTLEYGSAEMNYLTILACRKAGENELANQLKQSWINLNKDYFEQHGFILERYNLKEPQNSSLEPQRIDGALGVLLALINE